MGSTKDVVETLNIMKGLEEVKALCADNAEGYGDSQSVLAGKVLAVAIKYPEAFEEIVKYIAEEHSYGHDCTVVRINEFGDKDTIVSVQSIEDVCDEEGLRCFTSTRYYSCKTSEVFFDDQIVEYLAGLL